MNKDLTTKTGDLTTFLFKKGSSWAEKGGKLERDKTNKFNSIEFSDFQKGGSRIEKGGK